MYDQVLDTLKECRYSVLTERDDLDKVYRLRYESYLDEGAITKNDRGMMSDSYDESPNCVHVAVEMNGEYVAAMRLHLLSSQTPHSPTLEVFPEIESFISSGQTLLDPTRFVVSPEARKSFVPVHLVAVRIPILASIFYDVDIVLVAVRAEHSAFYRRYLGCESFAMPRPYLGITKPLGLMMSVMQESRHKVIEKNPFFGPLDTIPQSNIAFPELPGVFPGLKKPGVHVA